MKILDGLKSIIAPAKKDNIGQNAQNILSSILLSGDAPKRRGISKLLETYKNLPWLVAVNFRISKSFSAVPWELYGIKNEKKKFIKVPKLQKGALEYRQKMYGGLKEKGLEQVEILEHPLLELLDNYNDEMTGGLGSQITQLWIDLVGEAFWLKERDGLGVPIAIWPIPPTWVDKTPTKDKPWFEFYFSDVKIPKEEVVWFREPNPINPWGRGVGLGASLTDELDIDEYAAQHAKAWFYNKARPDLVISPENPDEEWEEEDTKKLEYNWLSKSRGFWRSFKPFFFSRKIHVKEISQTFEEMQMLELRKYERDMIIHVYGVPPEVLGIVENSNRSTIEAADFLFSKWVLTPRLDSKREYLQMFLVPDFDDRLLTEFVSPATEDKEYKLSVYKTVPYMFTKDEWRDLAGDKELPDDSGKVFSYPFTVFDVPLGEEPVSPNNNGDNGDKKKRTLQL